MTNDDNDDILAHSVHYPPGHIKTESGSEEVHILSNILKKEGGREGGRRDIYRIQMRLLPSLLFSPYD